MGSDLGWELLKLEQAELFIASNSDWIPVGDSCYKQIKSFDYEISDANTERYQPSSLFDIRYTWNTKTNEKTVIVDLKSPNLQFMMERALDHFEIVHKKPLTSVDFKTLFHNRTQLRMFRDVYSKHLTHSSVDEERFVCFIEMFENLCQDLDDRLETLVQCGEITWHFVPELFLPGTKILRNDKTNGIQDEGTCLECTVICDKDGPELICLSISPDQGEECSISIHQFDSEVAIRSLGAYPKDMVEDKNC